MAHTWDKIGSLEFIELQGDLSEPGIEVEEITRPWVDGVAFRRMGTRGRPMQLRGLVDVANAAAADALLDTYKALQGTLVTIRMKTVNRANYIVLNVEILGRRKVSTVSGGTTSGVWLVESGWTVQYAGT